MDPPFLICGAYISENGAVKDLLFPYPNIQHVFANFQSCLIGWAKMF